MDKLPPVKKKWAYTSTKTEVSSSVKTNTEIRGVELRFSSFSIIQSELDPTCVKVWYKIPSDFSIEKKEK